MSCLDTFQTTVGLIRPYGPNTRDTRFLLGLLLGLGVFYTILHFTVLSDHGNRFFVEGDPALSNPFIPDNEALCPIWLLMVTTMVMPLVIFLVFHLAVFGNTSVGARVHPRLLVTLTYFALSFLVSMVATQVLKHYEGRLRPDFFAMCNYKGYRTALDNCPRDSGTWWTCAAGYGYNIEKGAPGNFDHCLDQDELSQARSSYPSGHSSMPASNYGFLAFFLFHSFTGAELWHDCCKVVLPTACVFGAVMIAATRPKDYWHNFSDINMGLLIGFTCAIFGGYQWSLHMVKAPLDQNDAEVLNTPATTTDLEASSGQVSQMQRTGLSGQSLSSSDAAASGESELHSE